MAEYKETHIVKTESGPGAASESSGKKGGGGATILALLLGALLVGAVALVALGTHGSFVNGPNGQRAEVDIKSPIAPAPANR